MSMMSCVLDEVFSFNTVTNSNLDGSMDCLNSFYISAQTWVLKVFQLLRCGPWLRQPLVTSGRHQKWYRKTQKCLMFFDRFHCSVENLQCGHRFPWAWIHTELHPSIHFTCSSVSRSHAINWILCSVFQMSSRELTLLSLEQTNTEI